MKKEHIIFNENGNIEKLSLETVAKVVFKKEFLTINEITDYIDIDNKIIREWCLEEKIKSIKIGKVFFIKHEELKRLIRIIKLQDVQLIKKPFHLNIYIKKDDYIKISKLKTNLYIEKIIKNIQFVWTIFMLTDLNVKIQYLNGIRYFNIRETENIIYKFYNKEFDFNKEYIVKSNYTIEESSRILNINERKLYELINSSDENSKISFLSKTKNNRKIDLIQLSKLIELKHEGELEIKSLKLPRKHYYKKDLLRIYNLSLFEFNLLVTKGIFLKNKNLNCYKTKTENFKEIKEKLKLEISKEFDENLETKKKIERLLQEKKYFIDYNKSNGIIKFESTEHIPYEEFIKITKINKVKLSRWHKQKIFCHFETDKYKKVYHWKQLEKIMILKKEGQINPKTISVPLGTIPLRYDLLSKELNIGRKYVSILAKRGLIKTNYFIEGYNYITFKELERLKEIKEKKGKINAKILRMPLDALSRKEFIKKANISINFFVKLVKHGVIQEYKNTQGAYYKKEDLKKVKEKLKGGDLSHINYMLPENTLNRKEITRELNLTYCRLDRLIQSGYINQFRTEENVIYYKLEEVMKLKENKTYKDTGLFISRPKDSLTTSQLCDLLKINLNSLYNCEKNGLIKTEQKLIGDKFITKEEVERLLKLRKDPLFFEKMGIYPTLEEQFPHEKVMEKLNLDKDTFEFFLKKRILEFNKVNNEIYFTEENLENNLKIIKNYKEFTIKK